MQHLAFGCIILCASRQDNLYSQNLEHANLVSCQLFILYLNKYVSHLESISHLDMAGLRSTACGVPCLLQGLMRVCITKLSASPAAADRRRWQPNASASKAAVGAREDPIADHCTLDLTGILARTMCSVARTINTGAAAETACERAQPP
jgi:hypothetical protein